MGFSRDLSEEIKELSEPKDDATTAYAIFKDGKEGPLALGSNGRQIVLEEYCFTREEQQDYPSKLAKALADLLPDDAICKSIKDRLVILSNGMMSHFVTTACEVAQHVRISDETGTAEGTGLFNQENVPSETLFYSVLNATAAARRPFQSQDRRTGPQRVQKKVDQVKVFQFGGDASTGLGFCSVAVSKVKGV